LTAITVGAATMSASLITLWTGQPTTRSEFKTRGKRNIGARLLELCNLLSWAALSWLLSRATLSVPGGMAVAGMGAAFGVAAGSLLVAWLLGRRSR
jgi:hypothetical protein